MSGNPIRRHPIVTLGIILFVAVAALVAFGHRRQDRPAARTGSSPWHDGRPSGKDLDVRLTYTADLIPNQLVNIFSRVDGYHCQDLCR